MRLYSTGRTVITHLVWTVITHMRLYSTGSKKIIVGWLQVHVLFTSSWHMKQICIYTNVEMLTQDSKKVSAAFLVYLGQASPPVGC
nr:hypothetical protein [Tanacetum cinerariifolium]